MPFINGYKFSTEAEAQQACRACSLYYGLPKQNNYITKEWVNYNYASLNTPEFYYIIFDKSLTAVLGSPINFEVIQPKIKI